MSIGSEIMKDRYGSNSNEHYETLVFDLYGNYCNGCGSDFAKLTIRPLVKNKGFEKMMAKDRKGTLRTILTNPDVQKVFTLNCYKCDRKLRNEL